MLRSLLAALLAVLVLAAPAAAADFSDADYFTVADKLQQTLDSHWDGDAGYYKLGGGGTPPARHQEVSPDAGEA